MEENANKRRGKPDSGDFSDKRWWLSGGSWRVDHVAQRGSSGVVSDECVRWQHRDDDDDDDDDDDASHHRQERRDTEQTQSNCRRATQTATTTCRRSSLPLGVDERDEISPFPDESKSLLTRLEAPAAIYPK